MGGEGAAFVSNCEGIVPFGERGLLLLEILKALFHSGTLQREFGERGVAFVGNSEGVVPFRNFTVGIGLFPRERQFGHSYVIQPINQFLAVVEFLQNVERATYTKPVTLRQ